MDSSKYIQDLDALIKQADDLLLAMYNDEVPEQLVGHLKAQKKTEAEIKKLIDALPSFKGQYQHWYSEALSLLQQVLPSRVDDFIGYYKPLRPRKELAYGTYTISDYLEGVYVTRGALKEKIVGPDAAIPKFQQQLQIIAGLKRRFKSTLFDIRTLVQAELFDNELDVAEELLKNGFLRAAGAVSGVVLEGHFKEVAANHSIKMTKKDPSIADYNDALKNNSVIGLATWRHIQLLGDIRNICDHKKSQEPTKEQVNDLIAGTKKIIKTVS